MDPRISRISLRVRGYHLDGYGHVNNTRYLEFLEEGRWAYFDEHPELSTSFQRAGIGLVAVNINIDYCAAAVAGDDLEVHSRLSAIGNRSGKMTQEIHRSSDDTLVSRATITFVLLDMQANQPLLIEGPLRDELSALVLE
ncbi:MULTISPECIES: acyl-CoA thioesterase [Halomonadaceae]|uniref:Acyl-CoA thioesterase n=1 Tax=Billgrantia aerodenitrificans TaxID=2733483 RepID=A0ABS9AZ73_9GAMM|nr:MULTISPECIES: thioesterase family protein [Halomonas]MCE8026917.1 acyl-CoA thioesterase [Halomonas aerodenitrificans]MCE8040303.1 acyl-CoA thioesterase [Halomonas sp. MCCC 1A11062]